jgi:hypothetical protein
MRRRHLVAGAPLLFLLPCCATTPAVAVPPSGFHPGVKLEAGGEEIDIRVGHLVPHAADWNGDGLPDLVVGQFDGGKVRLYLNEGTANEPRLGASTFLEAGGAQISLPCG